jgi:hypothetical protein
LPADLLVVQGEAVLEVKLLSLPVPVVYAYSGDPVAAGLAESLARPNANMTGLTYLAVELSGKRLELLRELAPDVRRVALLANPVYPGQNSERANAEATAARMRVDVDHVPARTSDELSAAFKKMRADRTQAISLFADGFTVQNRAAIVDFALAHRLPLVSSWPVFRQRRALHLRAAPGRLVPPPRLPRRPRPAWHQARRAADRAADDDRDDRQPQDRRRDRASGAADGAGPRRPRDPLTGAHRKYADAAAASASTAPTIAAPWKRPTNAGPLASAART